MSRNSGELSKVGMRREYTTRSNIWRILIHCVYHGYQLTF